MQLVMAAMTTAPWPISVVAAAASPPCAVRARSAAAEAEAALLDRSDQRLLERRLHLGQGHAVLGTLGPGQARLHRRQVQRERVREDGVGRRRRCGRAPAPCSSARPAPTCGGAARAAQVAQRLVVDGEEAAGGAVLRRHVRDGGAVGQAHLAEAGAEELDELLHHALLAQDLGDGEDEVGGGDALAQGAGQAEAHHLRREHVERLAEHGRLGLDAAHAPAEHAEAVDHRGVRVGADQRVREGHRRAPPSVCVITPWARYSRFTWWTMPVAGGTTRKSWKALAPHFRNS